MRSLLLPPVLCEDVVAGPASDDDFGAPTRTRRSTDAPRNAEFPKDSCQPTSEPQLRERGAPPFHASREPESGPMEPGGEVATSNVVPRAPLATSHRPQGRLLVAAALVAAMAWGAVELAGAIEGASPAGVVIGRVVAIEGPWEGLLTEVAVKQGDAVRAGDVLACIEDEEANDRQARLADELRTVSATLRAKAVSLEEDRERRRENAAAAQAALHAIEGELAVEQGRLADLSGKLKRRRELAERGMVVAEELESVQHVQSSLRQKIAHLEKGRAAAQDRLKAASLHAKNEVGLDPLRAQIAQLRAEIARTVHRRTQGVLRAGVDGIVVAVTAHAGERVRPGKSVVELLELNSLEAALYVDVAASPQFAVGRCIEVLVAPANVPVACEVVRLGRRVESLPPALRNPHRPDAVGLPVYLSLRCDAVLTTPPLGSVVRMKRWLSEAHQ